MINLNTKICFSKATFEFREVDSCLAKAKHERIIRMFAEALSRQEKTKKASRGC